MARLPPACHVAAINQPLSFLHRYVEYDASGRVIKGEEVRAHSRYEEDAYINNHTAVWGSFWRDGAWGYACCRSTVKQSYCVGHAGIAAEQAQVRWLMMCYGCITSSAFTRGRYSTAQGMGLLCRPHTCPHRLVACHTYIHDMLGTRSMLSHAVAMPHRRQRWPATWR